MNKINDYKNNPIVKRFSNKNYFKGKFTEEGLEAVKDYKKKISFTENINYKFYAPRNLQRYHLITDTFKDYLVDGKVLDVGTRTNTLSELLERQCCLVDKNNPNLPEFDWEKENLPFKDKSFDTVVCMDVMEHIDRFHGSFADIMRTSKKYVIISLPNCWRKALNEFIKGRGRQASYGLPPEKTFDRHKWFFNPEDVENFIYYNSASSLYNYEVKEVRYHIPKTILRIKILYPILKFILPERHFKNLFVETIFFVLEKKSK